MVINSHDVPLNSLGLLADFTGGCRRWEKISIAELKLPYLILNIEGESSQKV
jgi:hypothetical protein